MDFLQIVAALLGLVGGGLAMFFYRGSQKTDLIEQNRLKMDQILQESKQQAQAIRQEAKADLEALIQSEKEETERMNAHVVRLEESVKLQEKHLKHLQSIRDETSNRLTSEEHLIDELRKNIDQDRRGFIDALLKKLGKTQAQVLQDALIHIENEILSRKDKWIQTRIATYEEDSSKFARDVLIGALQRYGDASSVDHTDSLVTVQHERFKPLLVGPNAQNIDYLETQTDLIVLFNDEPKTITIAGGNLIKRQILKFAIESLQVKMEVNSALIDRALKMGEEKVHEVMMKQAKWAIQKIGLSDVPEGLLKHIGRLHFRTSYGQNALKHCLEVGFFSGLMAAEVGADVEVARLAGFFHDVGKALSEESDKGHDFITKDILEEFNYPEEIVHAAWVHHEAEPAKSLEAKIVMAADALSASRPGARLESLDRYLERIRALESTAGSFEGVKKTFAISAGREVRVVVYPDKVSDQQLIELAHQIAQKIEQDLTYPGNIKVNAIRRMKWRANAQVL